jgi:nitrogen fixation protein FixH
MALLRLPGRKPRQPGWYIPWLFVLGFLVVFAANGTLIHFAYSSWTGLTTEHAYDEGVAYNRTLAAQRAQERLGWQVKLDFAGTQAGGGRIALALADREGRPLDGAEVTATLVRPTSGGHDHSARLEAAGPGQYQAAMALDLPGNWDLRLEIHHPAGDWQKVERVWIKP